MLVPYATAMYTVVFHVLYQRIAYFEGVSQPVVMVIAGVVILLLTSNVLVAAYCALAIGLLIGAVTGIVVLEGWRLGIIESVVFSTAIGMACDFVAHLGFAYRQANRSKAAETREELVSHAIGRITPAVTAAAHR